MKFLITGPWRSGTTYMSCILNSQQNAFCWETPLNNAKKINDQQGLNIYNSIFNVPLLTFPSINIKPLNKYPLNKIEIIDQMLNNIGSYYNVDNHGFKQTMINESDLLEYTKKNFKIIIMRRKFDDLFQSALNRITEDKDHIAEKLKIYYESIDNYNFKKINQKNILIVDFEDLITDINSTLFKISDFLEFKVTNPEVLYYRYAKNIGDKSFSSNSSYFDTNKFIISKDTINKYEAFVLNKKKFNLMNLKYIIIRKISKKYYFYFSYLFFLFILLVLYKSGKLIIF